MKTACIALTVLASANAIQPVTDNSLTIDQEFDQWASVYGKHYSTEVEKALRKQIFQKNRNTVITHNQEYENGVHSFNLELNNHADITNAEYQQQMLGFSSSAALTAAQTYNAPNGTAPASWDWRDTKNVVGAVKNQGSCGSCWAFSAVATMEGAYNLKTGSLNSFSEQELVDCVNGGTSTCSVGGEMYQGVEYGISNGMMSEADYPYKGSSGNKCAFDKTKVVKQFSGYTNITSGVHSKLLHIVNQL
jgi:C1A family cysteine protease